MIDGITVMMLTDQLKLIHKQVKRGDECSSIAVPGHLRNLSIEARGFADAVANYIPSGPADAYLNASKGGP